MVTEVVFTCDDGFLRRTLDGHILNAHITFANRPDAVPAANRPDCSAIDVHHALGNLNARTIAGSIDDVVVEIDPS